MTQDVQVDMERGGYLGSPGLTEGAEFLAEDRAGGKVSNDNSGKVGQRLGGYTWGSIDPARQGDQGEDAELVVMRIDAKAGELIGTGITVVPRVALNPGKSKGLSVASCQVKQVLKQTGQRACLSEVKGGETFPAIMLHVQEAPFEKLEDIFRVSDDVQGVAMPCAESQYHGNNLSYIVGRYNVISYASVLRGTIVRVPHRASYAPVSTVL